LASAYRNVRFALIEGSARRADFLRAAVDRCGFTAEVEVVGERAEVVGRSPTYRGAFSVVVARLLGSPAEVAEMGAPLLRRGGLLVVSEPPGDSDRARWPVDGVNEVGLELTVVGHGYAVLQQMEICPDRYPRRTGIPRKRPIF
jgi:16S rRNA (guanine527-N7)-methyltransferase